MLMNLLSAFEPRQEWFHYHPAVNSNIIKFKFNIIKIYCHSCHDMRKCFICWQLDPIFSQWLLLLSQCQKNELLKSLLQKKKLNMGMNIVQSKSSKGLKLSCIVDLNIVTYHISFHWTSIMLNLQECIYLQAHFRRNISLIIIEWILSLNIAKCKACKN